MRDATRSLCCRAQPAPASHTRSRLLRVTPEGRMYSAQERATTEWRRRLVDFLGDLAKWDPTGEASEADFFHQKALVYESLVELTPKGEERDKLIGAFVSCLASSNLQQRNPVEWFWHAHAMYNRLRLTGDGETGKLLAAYRSSPSVVLTLYAALTEVFPQSGMFS